MHRRTCFLALPCVWVSGCARLPQTRRELPPGLSDGLPPPAGALLDRAKLFALSPAMLRFVQDELARPIRLHGPRRGLFEALREGGYFNLEYDASITRTASEAFEAKRGNCMSLVLMTAAFARALGLDVTYQTLQMDEIWGRSQSVVFLSGHVNISLHTGAREQGRGANLMGPLTIDFIPIDEASRLRATPLSEDQLVALFWNNRAVEAMELGRLNEAHAYALAALAADPGLLTAMNTLAVVLRRKGKADLAERCLLWVLEQDPRNVPALSNWVLVLRESGRETQALEAQARLRAVQPQQPFAAFELGREAAARGDWAAALAAFEQEEERGTVFHELFFWLARCHYELGQRSRVEAYLKRAAAEAQTPDQRQRYALKLEALRRPKATATGGS